MRPFRYQRTSDVASAIQLTTSNVGSEYLAGGTSQVDLMKEGVQRPAMLVDISGIPMSAIERLPNGGLRIGANVKNAVAAEHPLVQSTYPAVSEALLAGASQQIRNVASMAGNLLQRTRCPYLRDPAQKCNKRSPGTGCAAVEGYNRVHAIFGATNRGADDPATCIATHPSDFAVALAAHKAVIVVEGTGGERRVTFDDLHRLPESDPGRDTTLAEGDLIVAIELPAFSGHSHYLKVRDRASYAYGLVTCAVALEVKGGLITSGQIALGGVAHKPWRAFAAEALLVGARVDPKLFKTAADVALQGSRTYAMNGYKPAMGRALVERALLQASGLEPLQGKAGTVFASSVGGIAGVNILQPASSPGFGGAA